MDFLLDALTNWLKEMLVGGIMGNLSGMFDSVNQQVADISVQVGQTPQGWNGSIFSMIQNLSNSIMVPIAGVILAIVMTLELIQMITDRNNLHDVDTWMIFKWVFKSAAAILLVTNTWNLVMGVFDMAQSVVAQGVRHHRLGRFHRHLRCYDRYGVPADGYGPGAAVRPVVPVAFYRHYHVGAVYLHFHRHLWPYDRNLPCHVGGPHPDGDHDGQGIGSMISGTTYPSDDPELVAVEADYAAKEAALQAEIDNIESSHPGYDEYRYDLDMIGHDPHELAAYLSAVLQGYTRASAQGQI